MLRGSARGQPWLRTDWVVIKQIAERCEYSQVFVV
jgi:hypothetical protein